MSSSIIEGNRWGVPAGGLTPNMGMIWQIEIDMNKKIASGGLSSSRVIADLGAICGGVDKLKRIEFQPRANDNFSLATDYFNVVIEDTANVKRTHLVNYKASTTVVNDMENKNQWIMLVIIYDKDGTQLDGFGFKQNIKAYMRHLNVLLPRMTTCPKTTFKHLYAVTTPNSFSVIANANDGDDRLFVFRMENGEPSSENVVLTDASLGNVKGLAIYQDNLETLVTCIKPRLELYNLLDDIAKYVVIWNDYSEDEKITFSRIDFLLMSADDVKQATTINGVILKYLKGADSERTLKDFGSMLDIYEVFPRGKMFHETSKGGKTLKEQWDEYLFKWVKEFAEESSSTNQLLQRFSTNSSPEIVTKWLKAMGTLQECQDMTDVRHILGEGQFREMASELASKVYLLMSEETLVDNFGTFAKQYMPKLKNLTGKQANEFVMEWKKVIAAIKNPFPNKAEPLVHIAKLPTIKQKTLGAGGKVLFAFISTYSKKEVKTEEDSQAVCNLAMALLGDVSLAETAASDLSIHQLLSFGTELKKQKLNANFNSAKEKVNALVSKAIDKAVLDKTAKDCNVNMDGFSKMGVKSGANTEYDMRTRLVAFVQESKNMRNTALNEWSLGEHNEKLVSIMTVMSPDIGDEISEQEFQNVICAIGQNAWLGGFGTVGQDLKTFQLLLGNIMAEVFGGQTFPVDIASIGHLNNVKCQAYMFEFIKDLLNRSVFVWAWSNPLHSSEMEKMRDHAQIGNGDAEWGRKAVMEQAKSRAWTRQGGLSSKFWVTLTSRVKELKDVFPNYILESLKAKAKRKGVQSD
eukprot:GHVS01086445.1.p1 GENE.GHVS01086445.1~~GHVS01086445.1.p1  ORF type:complete len:836 (+),score=69.94 GHVS01086445.1:97-2508(+)